MNKLTKKPSELSPNIEAYNAIANQLTRKMQRVTRSLPARFVLPQRLT